MKDGRQGENHKAFAPEDIRFTTKNGNLYSFVLAPPTKDILITTLATGGSLKGEIKGLALLGSSETLKWSRSAAGLTIKRPKSFPCKYAVGFQMLLK